MRRNYSLVCALDREEVKSNLSLARELHSLGLSEVYLFKLSPYKDFGENGIKNPADLQSRCLPYYKHNEKLLINELGL
jgi:hypothetical protein